MNNYIPDWNFEGDLPVAGQKTQTGADHDLVELLWRNGQVVLHSQTHRKQALNTPNEPRTRQAHNKPQDQPATRPCDDNNYGNSITNLVPDDETVSWIHFPVEDSFEKEFCSNFFSEPPPAADPTQEPGPVQMPPPRAHGAAGSRGKVVNFPPRESSLATVGLSHCGSNQLGADPDASWVSSNTGLSAPPPSLKGGAAERESRKTETLEPTVTSSSGGSGSSFGRACKQSTATTISGNKRKTREADELECESEAAELEFEAANKPAQRSGNSRKTRAAEVHNLSERRRRDRINEKMKALQELIPHSNKTDKASMLDEAIEYLKSLQLQLQVMWMGSGMTPMMFPGMQHYMSRMSMAMGPPAMQLAGRVPLLPDHQAAAAPPMMVGPAADQQPFNPLNHQMQNASFTDQYARFMGFHPMQTHVSPPVNIFRFSPHTVQQQQQIAHQGIIDTGPSSGGAPTDSCLSGKMG